jgi:signal transduction histidine kinase
VPGRLHRSYGEGPTGESLRIVGRRVAFEEGEWVYVMVAGAAETIEADTARFMTRLGVVLSIFAAILVAATFVQWRISLRPLRRLGRELQAIREGNARHVSTRYPTEIAPVAAALNDLIDSNHATLERSRRHVGNLAHALKTPISVLVNDAAGAEGPLARSVGEQTAIMERQVRFYLERAQMAARERTIGMVTQVAPVLSRLHRAMARLGERRGIDVHLENGHEVRFAGEQQDLEEIVGNLVDNALKFAHGRVTITVSPTADPPTGREGGFFRITIADDGPGLSEAEREAVLSRGKRLDQSKPGSGLGLSIVAELVELYGGALCLGCPPAGGLEVAVVLPRA